MKVETWLEAAKADAERRNLPGLLPLLEAVAKTMTALRAADFEAALAFDPGAPAAPDRATVAHEPAGPEASEPQVEGALAKIAELNPQLNAFVTVTADEARAAARARDRETAAGRARGPVHGRPIALKDIVDMTGVPTSASSNVRKGHVAARDAVVTARLREAGAVFVGKTNLHEFALGTTSEDSRVRPGAQPVRSRAIARRVERRLGHRRRHRHGVGSGRHRYGRIDSHPGRGVRPGRAQTAVGRDLRRRGGPAQPAARPRRPDRADGVGCVAVVRRDEGGKGDSPLFGSDRREKGTVPFPRCALASRAATSSIGSTRTWSGRSSPPSSGCAAPGAAVVDVTIPHVADTPNVYLLLAISDAAEFHARTLESRPFDYTEPVRLRLEMGRYMLSEDYVRALRGRDGPDRAASMRRWPTSTCWRCRRCRSRRRRSARRACRSKAAPNPCAPRCCAARSHSTSPGTRRCRCRAAGPRRACRSACSWSAAASAPRPLLAAALAVERALAHDPALFSSTGNSGSPTSAATIAWSVRSTGALDWLDAGAPGTPAPRTPAPAPRTAHGAPRTISSWVDDVMRDTDAFFTPPPTRDYTLTPAGGAARAGGEAGTLTFPSALTTPHPENNLVRARFFPAADPQAAAGVAAGAARRGGDGAVELRRRGAHRAVPDAVAPRHRVAAHQPAVPRPAHAARADPRRLHRQRRTWSRTVQVCRQAVLDVRRALWWLRDQGYDRLGLLGTSLGSCLAMLTSSHEPLVRAQALNHVSPFFADVVWRGLSTAHVRKGLDGHIDLDTLRELWRPISPWSYLDRINGKKTLLVYAKYDRTFPVDLSLKLVDEWRRRDSAPRVAVLPCGHYSTGRAPFKFLDGWYLGNFLDAQSVSSRDLELAQGLAASPLGRRRVASLPAAGRAR